MALLQFGLLERNVSASALPPRVSTESGTTSTRGRFATMKARPKYVLIAMGGSKTEYVEKYFAVVQAE